MSPISRKLALYSQLALLGFAFSRPAQAAEALLVADTTMYGTYGLGTDVGLAVSSTSTKCALMKFDIASMLPGVTADQVVTASLRFYTRILTGTGSINVHKATGAWTETSTGNYSTYEPTAFVTMQASALAVYQFTAIDVTNLVKGWITTPSTNHGVVFRPSGTINFEADSKESTGNPPILDITLKSGVRWLTGLVNPTTQGNEGDFYVNTVNKKVFGPKTGTTWPEFDFAGPQGPQGDPGPAGYNGATIIIGYGNPQPNDGIEGDFFLSGSDLYGPKTSGGGWSWAASLAGPKGATGERGPQGMQGPEGPVGPAGTVGPQGPSGNLILTGYGAPGVALGENFYLDLSNYDFYNAAWTSPKSLRGAKGDEGPKGDTGEMGNGGASGNLIYSGTLNPQTTAIPTSVTPFVSNGDFYYNTQTNTLYGPKVYHPQLAQAWAQSRSLIGPAGTSILGGPLSPGSAGQIGDFYIDTNLALLYGPKTVSGWGTGFSLVGPQGLQGNQGIAGLPGDQGPAGRTILGGLVPPSATDGEVGDLYVDTISATLYGPKTADPVTPWPVASSLTGPRGSALLSGTGVPNNGDGLDGDYYLDLTARVLYGPKTGNVWAAEFVSLKGDQGVPGAVGPAGVAPTFILPQGDISMGSFTGTPPPVE